jgi:hypothetical protein
VLVANSANRAASAFDLKILDDDVDCITALNFSMLLTNSHAGYIR